MVRFTSVGRFSVRRVQAGPPDSRKGCGSRRPRRDLRRRRAPGPLDRPRRRAWRPFTRPVPRLPQRTGPILELTQAADVGMGSFYNHFESKEQLFHAAVEEALDAHGALLDRLSADTDDPAEGLRAQFPAHRAPSPPTAPIEQRPAPQRLRDRHRRQGNRAPCPSRYRGSSLSRPLQRL